MAKEAHKYPFYVRGNSSRGEEVIKLLEERGGNRDYYCGNDDTCLYYIREDGKVDICDMSDDEAKFMMSYWEEITLPEPEWTPQRGETVLAFKPIGIWVEAVYSFKKNNKYYMVGGSCYEKVKKFDEKLLGT